MTLLLEDLRNCCCSHFSKQCIWFSKLFKLVVTWLLFQTPVLLEIVGLFVLQRICYCKKSTLVAASAVLLYLVGIRTNFASEFTIKPAVYFHFTTSKMSEQKIALVVRAVFFNWTWFSDATLFSKVDRLHSSCA